MSVGLYNLKRKDFFELMEEISTTHQESGSVWLHYRYCNQKKQQLKNIKKKTERFKETKPPKNFDSINVN